MKAIGTLVLMMCFLNVPAPVFGQAHLKKAVPDDYKLWGTLANAKICPMGDWASWSVGYESGADTLMVAQTQGGKRYAIAGASESAFSSDGKWWAAVVHGHRNLHLLRLSDGSMRQLEKADNFEFLTGGKHMALVAQNNAATKLTILNLETNNQSIHDSIAEYSFSPNGKRLALISKGRHEVLLVSVNTGALQQLAMPQGAKYRRLTWNSKSNALAFFEQGSGRGNAEPSQRIVHISFEAGESTVVESDTIVNFNGVRDKIIIPENEPVIQLSDDGKRVFFYHKSVTPKFDENEVVQVWDSQRPLLYTREKIWGSDESRAKLALWTPRDNRFIAITTTGFPEAVLLQGMHHALVFNSRKYEPQYEQMAPADYNIIDLDTGKNIPAIKKQYRYSGFISASPSGRHISYFNSGHWHIYDIIANKHKNLTAHLTHSVADEDHDQGGIASPYGSPGWTADGKYLLVYDKYDIWKIPIANGHPQRLTLGRTSRLRFRISDTAHPENVFFGSGLLASNHFDLKKPLTLEATADDKSSGLYTLASGSIKKLFHNQSQATTWIKAMKGQSYIGIEESFTIPPRLVFVAPNMQKEKVIYQSNNHQFKYSWGHNELVHYTALGKSLQGILYYPAGYDPSRKYPMIVHVYERQSNKLHRYINPSLMESNGFNPTNYTLDSYLVLYPDIAYEVGNPGKSSVECVLTAVKAVSDKGMVDTNRIGLIGHSFGGYETAFIITQTNVFAAAVAGAAVSDMVSRYLSIDGSGNAYMWRYETQQSRIGTSLFENYKGYVENSPVANAAKIKTPLLLWAGQSDKVVNWQQGLALHLALRRLQKKNIFLVYPGEKHIISKTNAKVDLMERVRDWFEFFLKT